MNTLKNNQDRLQEIFDGFIPALSSEQDFLKRMETHLEVAEYIRGLQVEEVKRHRRTICLAFVGGVVACFLFMTFIMSEPLSLPILHFSVQNIPFLVCYENLRLASSIFAAFVLGTVICVLSIIYHEVMDMRESCKHKGESQLLSDRNS